MLVPEPRVPVDEPRDHALGRLRAGRDADAAARGAREARAARRPPRAAVGALGRASLAALRAPGASGSGAGRSLRRRARWSSSWSLALPVLATRHRDAVDQGRAGGRSSRQGYEPVQDGASVPARRARCRSSHRRPRTPRPSARPLAADRGDRRVAAAAASAPAGTALIQAIPTAGSLRPRRRRDDRPPARATCRPARWSEARPPRTTTSSRRWRTEDPARDRRRPRARVPAAAGRAPGAARRRDRSRHQPARDRRGIRCREADLPGRQPRRPARVRVAGLRRRVGARLLLRDDLRDLDGLHGVPARVRQGALGALGRSAGGHGRRASRTPGASCSRPRR